MKKIVRVVLTIVFVFGIILASTPQPALAKTEPEGSVTPKPLIAGGAWTTGSSVDVAALVGTAPTWLQWLANGVKVTEAGKICHPLRGGQFGWVGQIMQYKNGQWVKLTTTNDWVPNKEGEFMACAQAPAAGTYALFGYWIRPIVTVAEDPQVTTTFDCSTIEWYFSKPGVDPITFSGWAYGLPEGTEIDISVASISPIDSYITGGTSATTTDADGFFSLATSFFYPPAILTLTFSVPAYGCTKDHFFEF